MDDAELQRLARAARSHRNSAALARQEVATRGPAWWGHDLLAQSADYYERRALDVERQLQRLAERGFAPASPAEPSAGNERA